MGAERVIGVDIGGTRIRAGLVGRDGKVAQRTERPTPTASSDDLLAAVEDAVGELLPEAPAAVGVGAPGRVDRATGELFGTINTPLEGVAVVPRLSGFGIPVALDNDGNAAALAEWQLGAARGARTVVCLALGTGIGGGLVVDGRRYRGWAELGHLVVQLDGPPCQGSCRGRGHLEGLASGLAADALARRELGPGATARDLVAARHPALERIGRSLGAAIASLVNALGPDVVVIGGGFGAAAFELLLPPLREVLHRDALPPGGEVPVVRAALGADAGLVGAALVGFEALAEGV